MNRRLPTQTCRPPTVPRTPWPVSDSKSATGCSAMPRAAAPLTIACASVGGRKVVFAQFVRRDPAEGGAAEGLGLVAEPLATEEFEEDGLFGVSVLDRFNEFTDSYFDPEFFHEFSLKAGFEGLARLALAAGEFPKAAEVRIRVALSDEKFA